MEIKILQVFYDKNGLPYKDKERTVHYPITSGTFLGASNTTQIRFYYDQLDELNESTFVAVSKLPNGKIGSEILESEYDSELQENYAVLNLSQFYTQYKGDVFISLQGYQGGVRVEQYENGIYQIYGTPTIQATGSIKLSIAYAPTFIGSGQTENITLQRVLAELSTKLGIRQETLHVEELPEVGNPNVWYVVNDDTNDPNKANIYIWNAKTQSYVWVGDNTLNLGDYYTKEEGQEFENEIDERVSSVENELSSVASGSPKGVYATLSDLQTADPNHDYIYLVTGTGHWYYWNGTAWADGGAYLSNSFANNKLMNLALYGQLEIDTTNKTFTISGSFIFSKFGFVSLSSISIKTISYSSLSAGTYYLYIRNNVLYISNISVDCQDSDFILWIGYITSNIETEVYNCANIKNIKDDLGKIETSFGIYATSYTGSITVNSQSKTLTISNGYVWFNNNLKSINNGTTLSTNDVLNATAYLIYRNNAFQLINVLSNHYIDDIIFAIIWFDANGNVTRYVYNVTDIETIKNNTTTLNNKVSAIENTYPVFALSFTGSITIDTENKNYIISSGYVWYGDRINLSIPASTISYADKTNATSALIFRNGSFQNVFVNTNLQTGDIIFAINWFGADGTIVKSIFNVKDSEELKEQVKNITKLPISSKIFMKVGCIGDSYAEGFINSNATPHNPNYAWAKYMEQLTGNKYLNFGKSGSSTKSWVNGTLGNLAQVQAEGNKCQAYIIGLMINDQNSGMPTYVALGTDADIGTDADSYYAYYYKLINEVLTVNPDAKIFCLTCPKSGTTFASYNQAVVDIVEYCQNENKQVYLVDLRNYDWSNDTFVADELNGHYTAIGYEYMAEILNKALSDLVNNNVSDFQDVYMIPYDED